MRTETDSLGEVQVPEDRYWGAQTQRAIDNFPLSGRPVGRMQELNEGTAAQGFLVVAGHFAERRIDLVETAH